MPSPITASIGVELTLNLTAVHTSISAGLSDTNAPEDFIEDVAIDAVLYDYYAPEREGLNTGSRVLTRDILRGVDITNPHVILLLDNLLMCVNDAAEEALLAEVGDE